MVCTCEAVQAGPNQNPFVSCLFRYQLVCGLRATLDAPTPCTMMEGRLGCQQRLSPLQQITALGRMGALVAPFGKAEAFGQGPSAFPLARVVSSAE